MALLTSSKDMVGTKGTRMTQICQAELSSLSYKKLLFDNRHWSTWQEMCVPAWKLKLEKKNATVWLGKKEPKNFLVCLKGMIDSCEKEIYAAHFSTFFVIREVLDHWIMQKYFSGELLDHRKWTKMKKKSQLQFSLNPS